MSDAHRARRRSGPSRSAIGAEVSAQPDALAKGTDPDAPRDEPAAVSSFSGVSSGVSPVERARSACIEAALEAYEEASMLGLCREGAWEAAVSAMRRIELEPLAAPDAGTLPPATPSTASASPTAALAERLARPGAPAAGSAAASTGAAAAGLLEWVAARAQQRGPCAFRSRAGAIAGHAARLRHDLVALDHEDEQRVARMLAARGDDARITAARHAVESALEIARRCARLTTFAAETAEHGALAARADAETALRLAHAASASALGLVEDTLRHAVERLGAAETEAWLRDAKRQAWQAGLVLHRATCGIRAASDAPAAPGHAAADAGDPPPR